MGPIVPRQPPQAAQGLQIKPFVVSLSYCDLLRVRSGRNCRHCIRAAASTGRMRLRRWRSTAGWDLADQPLTPTRLVFDWHNFLSGCSTWDLSDCQIGSRRRRECVSTQSVHPYGNNPMSASPLAASCGTTSLMHSIERQRWLAAVAHLMYYYWTN